MAATSDEEMESLLSAFDQIYEVLFEFDANSCYYYYQCSIIINA